MKKKQIIWLQIIYWSLNFFGTVITPVFFFPKESDLQSTVLRITFFLAGIFTFYICFYRLKPPHKYPQLQKSKKRRKKRLPYLPKVWA